MRCRSLAVVVASLLVASHAAADTKASAKPDVRRVAGIIVMSPSPTQPAGPSLRLRTMVRPIDHLWVGPDIPAFVPVQAGKATIDLLDKTPSGGWVATYRASEDCGFGTPVSCAVTVKVYDAGGNETASVALDRHFSRPDALEVQDVRYVEEGAGGTLYFNEACQSFSREAGGKCSSLVALDPFAKKVLWRTASLQSNNEMMVVGGYVVTAYGFTGERASIRVVRRKDGAVLETKPLPATNFELTRKGDVLRVDHPTNVGNSNFRMVGFDGDAPKLVALPITPSDFVPKPYDPPPMNPPRSSRLLTF